MTPKGRALKLLDLLYAGGIDLGAWPPFIKALSDELGGAAIAVTTDYDDWSQPQESYWVDLDPAFAKAYERYAERGLPWGPLSDPVFLERFCRTSTLLPDDELAETPFFREWMQPQGLACEGPLVHAAPYSDRRPGWTIFIYRVQGARAFESDDIALCDLLAPHLATNSLVFDSYARVHRERVALAEVVDRIANGIFLVDAEGRVLLENLGARRIVEINDGIALEDGLLRLEPAEMDGELRRLLEAAIRWRNPGSIATGGELSVPRPSGKRSYVVTVLPMSAAEVGSTFGDDAAVVFVADTEADQSAAADRLRRTCQLTDAEADLVRLIAEGFSLEQISLERGVTMNTTRTHLKHVFSKTGTSRQSELVGKVLSAAVPRNG